MTTKEELEKSTFVGRNANVWFMFGWALAMFIIDGIVFAVDAPPGESKWEYGPSVFLMCLVRFFLCVISRHGSGSGSVRARCEASYIASYTGDEPGPGGGGTNENENVTMD